MQSLRSRIASGVRISAARLDSSAGVPFTTLSRSPFRLDRLASGLERSKPGFTQSVLADSSTKFVLFSDLSPICERVSGKGPRLARFTRSNLESAWGFNLDALQDTPSSSLDGKPSPGSSSGSSGNAAAGSTSADAPALVVLGKQMDDATGKSGFVVALDAASLPAFSSNDKPAPGLDERKIARNAARTRLQSVVDSLSADFPHLCGVSARQFMLEASEAISSASEADPMALEELQTMGMGRAVLQWHTKTGFCSSCGGRTAPDHGGMQRVCIGGGSSTKPGGCGTHHYPRTDPVVIAAVLSPDR